ncbi:alpha/beta fold hydrolase [uncultured Psychroserpens sp.]|uniref:alpha/beta hydrolase family protein n=1 Tax=uncultured Psychroserpens sp. TaxID=255436 RepID=UPI00260ADFDB|nr:alpha/beta fold hydrolase [uncultured Psychroserpens sp.]
MRSLVYIFGLFLFVGPTSLESQNDTVKFEKEDISITTRDVINIPGVIEYSNTGKRMPAAILIWGNGPHTRDQEISKTPMFKIISRHLVNNGFLVMRLDKRGFGKSSIKYPSSESDYTTIDLKNDIDTAINYLKTHSKVDTTKIGLIGHSEGAMIAAMLASENKVSWNIQIGSVGVSGKEIFLEQRKRNIKRLGIPDSTSVNIRRVFSKYVDFINRDFTNDSIHYTLGKEFLIAHGLNEDDKRITPKFIDQLLDGFRNKWNQCFFGLDMRTYQSKITIPTLIVMGNYDNQVTVDQNITELNKSLLEAGNKNYEIKILSESDHFFLTHNNLRLEKHKPEEMNVSRSLLNSIIDFLKNYN